jgi:pimeloyl-ACP methyl ester carboxylesterase
MVDGEIRLRDGRSVGYTDSGTAGQTAVLWCHGGPGSRLEPAGFAQGSDLRLIGIDRPGYGKSTPRPGRSIADWVPDALAVLDHLRVERCIAVGVSTGGAYALALAALAPERVGGVVACCALTDMRWAEGKAMMGAEGTRDVWEAPDRDTALRHIAGLFGDDGSGMLSRASGAEAGPPLPPADQALLSDPVFLAGMVAGFPAMFAHGVQGYVDDRIADGVGWGSFDVSRVRCPVVVVHGGGDTIVPVAHAHHTAALVPGAKLRVFDELGHFSIIAQVRAGAGRHRGAGAGLKRARYARLRSTAATSRSRSASSESPSARASPRAIASQARSSVKSSSASSSGACGSRPDASRSSRMSSSWRRRSARCTRRTSVSVAIKA